MDWVYNAPVDNQRSPIENLNGDWVRILCEFGDLILIPANTSSIGRNTQNFVKMRRFYKENDQ
ncbi:hypothetical protein COOONC_06174 [Cooperia oncophora]